MRSDFDLDLPLAASTGPVRPDYAGGGIVNLMASIIAAFGGGATGYPAASALHPERIGGRRNVILLVLDGIGFNYLAARPASFLGRHLHARLSSVFPPTTAAAIPVFLTGLAPQQHGLTGWFTWFKELGSMAAVLPFRPRHGGPTFATNGLDPAAVLVGTPVFDRLEAASFTVAPEYIAHSDFNQHYQGWAQVVGYDGLPRLWSTLADIVRAGKGRQYVYAYYPGWDECAHEYGVANVHADQEFSRLDRGLEVLSEELHGTDTLLLVTSDHGFVDLGPQGYTQLANHPDLAACLTLPLSGEPRAAYCYVHPSCEQVFLDYCRTELAEVVSCRRSSDMLREGWFGLGEPHPGIQDRIGDYVLLARDGHGLKDWILGERRYSHQGVHGGVSADEMYVPLVVIEA